MAPTDAGAVVETEVADQAGGAAVGRTEAGGRAEAGASTGAPTQDITPPTDDDDARELRMDRVAVLYGEITAATRAFLAAVAECDRHRDWEHAGFGSCAEWWVPRCRSPLHSRPATSALTANNALRLSSSQ